MRGNDQIFIMPTSLTNLDRRWEGMLIDFKPFSNDLHLLQGSVLDDSNTKPGWNDPFVVREKDIESILFDTNKYFK